MRSRDGYRASPDASKPSRKGGDMDGANERFMGGKSQWLADHLILYAVMKKNVSGDPFGQGHTAINAELPIHDFDLRKIGDIINNAAPGKCYELRKLDEFTGPKEDQPRKTSA